MKREKMTCERARNICIVQTLGSLNIVPSRMTEKDAWYLSPLRHETKASFHVSRQKNRWYDHGIGRGGNVIDLVVMIKNCSVKEALDHLSGEDFSFSFQQQNFSRPSQGKIKILKVREIEHPALVDYLQERAITLEVGRKFCKEVTYQLNNHVFFAIGLQNHLGGWELRNKYCKTSSSPKSYAYFERGKGQVIILEGMFDFLSLVLLDPEILCSSDFIVLNSLAFLNQAFPLVARYKEIIIYFDNDPSGRSTSKKLRHLFPELRDMSDTYKDFLDLNEKCVATIAP